MSADILKNGNLIKIIKTKEGSQLALEIFTMASETSTLQLLQKISLGPGHDTYINFNGASTNLALDDVDGDHRAEIIAPSLDLNFSPRLNVFRYSDNLNLFESTK